MTDSYYNNDGFLAEIKQESKTPLTDAAQFTVTKRGHEIGEETKLVVPASLCRALELTCLAQTELLGEQKKRVAQLEKDLEAGSRRPF